MKRSEEKINNRVSNAVVGLLVLISLALFANTIKADEVFKFKNPSFSGIGTGAHYLTIENQEFSREKAIKDAIEAARKAAEREANNTTLAKFMRSIVLVPKPEGSADVKSSGEILDLLSNDKTHLQYQVEDMGNDMRTLQEMMNLQERTRLIRTKSI